jgi:hypothetical protein
MMRVLKTVLIRSLATAALAATVAAGLTSNASAENVSFGTRPQFNGVPNANGNIVVYNLPSSGIYAGPVNTSFDLTARVQGGDGIETAAGFGLIASVSPVGAAPADGLVFNPPAIVGDANNLGAATNGTGFAINNSFDYRFANTNAQGGGNHEIDITAFEQVALQNNTVTDGDGIAAIPIQVAAGTIGNYNVAFNVSENYTGFVKTIAVNNTQFLTNAGAFPHVGATVEVRRSRKADMNGDVSVNSADIGGFILALNSVSNFQSQFPWLQTAYIGDINEDGNINSADIGGFIGQINNPSPSPSAVPEPSTFVLGGIAIAISGIGWARRRVRK